jgi:hypothetical protein
MMYGVMAGVRGGPSVHCALGPVMGEHSDAILGHVGLNAADIAVLQANGAVV